MAEEQDDIDLIEGFETVPRERAYDYFQAPDYEVMEGIYDDPEPGFVVPGDQFVSDPEADVAAVEEAEQYYSPATEAVSADEFAVLESELRSARIDEMRLSRPGHDDQWYQDDADRFIYQKQFTPSHLAPEFPERPTLDTVKRFYEQAPQQLRFGLHSENPVIDIYNAIDEGKSEEELQELLEKTNPSQWPDEMTMGAGIVDGVGRAFRRRVIDVPVGADTPGYEQRFQMRRDVQKEIQDIIDNEGFGSATSAVWNYGRPMSVEEATRAGMTFDDQATAKELAFFTTAGAVGGTAVATKNLGYLLPRAGTLGRTAGGLRSAVAGARVGVRAGGLNPVGMTVGAFIGGAIGYGAGKLWGKVDASEFFRPTPLFRQDANDDGYFFAVPAGLVNLSSRTQTLMGLSDSVWVPALANNEEDAERMRDMLAASRPSESWSQIVTAYKAEKRAGATEEELRERLRPDILQMVRNVSWNDLPSSAKYRDHLDLEAALQYAKENPDKGDSSSPRFTFEYFIAQANDRAFNPSPDAVYYPQLGRQQTLNEKNLQSLLESLPIGQILENVPEIIASNDQNGAIPSIDSFIDGVIIGAGETVEAMRATGGDTTEDVATGFAELMLKQEVDSNGQIRYVENTPGKLFRVASAIPELYNEMRLPFDLPLTPASRDFRYGLGIRDPDTGFLARVLGNVATGEVGLTRHITDEMLARGVDRQSSTYRLWATTGVLADTLVAWERPIFAGVGMPVRGGLRGAAAARQFKGTPYRSKAIIAAISPGFYQFKNNVDLNVNRGVINVREALGGNKTLKGLEDLQAGKVADPEAYRSIGISEQGVLDYVIPLVKAGQSVDDALDAVPRAAKGDMYQVLNHLVEQQVRLAADRGEDIYKQIPTSMRAGVDSVLSAAGIDPTAARTILNARTIRAKLIHANATERLMNQGSPDIQVLRASDEYKEFKNRLVDALEKNGDDVEKVHSYMPYLELQAYLEAINPASRFKSEIEFFGSLLIEKSKAKKPKDPGPDSAPPTAEPAGPRPIDPDDPLPEPFETEKPADVPPDYFVDPGDPLGPFDTSAPSTKDWTFVEVPSLANGGYWRSSDIESVLTPPAQTGVTVYNHSNAYGVTSPVLPTMARPFIGQNMNPVAHASKGDNQPYMTLYSVVKPAFKSLPSRMEFQIGVLARKKYGVTLDDVKDMYTSLVSEALVEFKKQLDSDPSLEFEFVDTLPSDFFNYRKIDGQDVVDKLGRLKKRLTFTAKESSKLKLQKEGKGAFATFKIKPRELARLQKQAAEAATDPDVTPPSAEVPTTFSANKKKFLSEYENVVNKMSIDDLTAKLGRSFIEILPDKSFSVRKLRLFPYVGGAFSRLLGSATLPKSNTKAGIRNRYVNLYALGKRAMDAKQYKGIDLTRLEPEDLYSLAVERFFSKEAGWKNLGTNGESVKFNSKLYSDTNYFVDAIGPVVSELTRREAQALGSGITDLDLIQTLKVRLQSRYGEGPSSKRIDQFVDKLDLSVRNHEYFRVGLVHTLVHELTHVLHLDVLSADELRKLRTAYARERDAGFTKWRRREQFKRDYDKELAFGEWLADTVSDYWISGNVQRHASFTDSEIGILRRVIRRMSALFSQVMGKTESARTTRNVEFPPEIIDLVDRLSRQAAEETSSLVGVRPRDEFFEDMKGALGPYDTIESRLDSLNSDMSVNQLTAARVPDWVSTIAAMDPDVARRVSASIAQQNGAIPGTKMFDDAVDYMISGGAEGRLFDGLTNNTRMLASETAPSPSPRSQFKIVSQRIALEDEIATGRARKRKKIILEGEKHAKRDVMYSYQGDALYRMLVEGDIDQLFRNEGVLVRQFLSGRDFKQLIKEAQTYGRHPRLTREGEDSLISSFKTYIETGKAPGPLRGLYDQLYLNLQGYWLRFTPDRQIIANPKIRTWFDTWLAADLNVRPMATELTGKVLRNFRKVRIAEPEDITKRLEEGMVAAQNKKNEFFRIPLDTPTVRNALRITNDSTDIDVVQAFARAAGYISGEYARITSGAEKMFPLTYRSIVPLKRVKTIQRGMKSRLDSVLGGDPDYFSQKGHVVLSDEQASSMRVFLRSLSNEPLANIVPYSLLSEDVSLRSIPEKHWNLIREALLDIEAGPNSVKTHYSEAISPTLAVAAWNSLKQMSVNAGDHSRAIRNMVNRFREMFVEVNTLADVGPFQRGIIESTLRELGSVGPEMRRAAADAYKGNKDLSVQQLFLMLKDTLVNKPVKIETVKTITGKSGVQRDISSVEYIMGVRGDVTAEGNVKAQEGMLLQLQQFRQKIGTDEMEGAAAAKRNAMLTGTLTDEGYAPTADPFGEPFADVPFIDFILSERKNLQAVMERPYASHHTFPGLDEYDAWSLVTLENYEKKLRKYRQSKTEGKEPDLSEFLTRQDFDAIEEALGYIYERLERQSRLIGDQSMKIAQAMGGGQEWVSGVFAQNTRLQGEFYQMFHRGQWDKMYEVFQRKYGEVVGTETRTKRPPLADPKTAITQMIAGMRAQEIISGLTQKMVQYGIASDVRDLANDFFMGANKQASYAKVNKSLYLKRIEFYLNQEVSFRMTSTLFRRQKELITEPPEAPTAGTPQKPLMPMSEIARAKRMGAPTDFNGNVHDLEAYTKALEILNNFGFKRARGGFERRLLPDGTEVFMPDAVQKAIDEAIDRATGAGGSRSVVSYEVDTDVLGPGFSNPAVVNMLKANAGKAVDNLFTLFPIVESKIKMGVTTGIILPNPAYFTGVFMGAGFQAMQGIGPIATGRMMLNPKQTGAVVARLWKDGGFQPNAAPVINRKTGAVYSIEQVTNLAEAHGLKSSFIHAETMKDIATDLKEFQPGFWNKMRVGRWAKNWQKTLIESATALDNYWRVSVFIDGLKRGLSPDAAAAMARKTGYDYAALTKFEKAYARRTVMFYSYMRKNMDLFWDTLLTNPERILGQMRMLRGIQTAFLEDDAQIVLKDYQQGRLPVFFKNTVINTHKYSQVMFITPPLPMMDALNFYIDMYDIAKFTDEGAIRGMANRIAPWYQSLFVMATGTDIFWDKELNEYNKVPEWLVELDLALTGGSLVHGLFDIQYRPHRDPSKSAISGESENGWWHARNGKAWWIWRSLLQFPGAGRSMDTITYMDRANMGVVEGAVRGARAFRAFGNELGVLEEVPEMGTGDTMGPRTGLTEAQEFVGWLGFKPTLIPTLAEQTSRDTKMRLGELKQALSRENLSTREYD